MKRATGPWLTPVGGLFVCLLLALLAAGRERMLRDPGTFWHTVVGERILQTGSLPMHDSFSFSAAGQKWLAQQWIGEVVMALVHRLSGLDGLLLAACAIIAGVLSVLANRLRGAGLPWLGVILLTMLALGASSCHFLPRPHLASLALMAATFGLLCDVETGRRQPITLLLLPPIMIFWTNTHGAALGGLATILLVLIGWLLAPRWVAVGSSRPSALLIAVVASLCAVAILLNPYGSALPAVWLGLMKSEVLPKLIVEHAPLNPVSPEGVMVLLLGGFYIILLIRAWPTRRSVAALIPLVWFALAISRVRHGPLFAVSALIGIAELLPHCRLTFMGTSSRPQRSPRLAAKHRAGGLLNCAIPAAFVAFAFVLQAAGLRVPLIGAGWARLDDSYWPSATVIALHEEIHRSGDPRVFNDLLFGGYLIYHAPGARVYIDDRCELYGDAGLLHYAGLSRDPAMFVAMSQYEDIRLALVANNSRLDRHLRESPEWTQLRQDPAAVLYARRPRG